MTLDKVALVTGAARGIGLAIAKQFLAEGYKVALLDVRDDELANAVADIARPDDILPLLCDVSNPEQVERAIADCVAEFGGLTTLVNNAGTASFKPITETSFEDWSYILGVNLSGPFLMVQAATPHLAKNGGAVVNITSISGFRASTLRVAYGVSKAGLAQLTKQQAAELGELGIRVNAVAPGPVNTAMAQKVHSAEIRAAYHDSIPLNRYGTEDEIANMVLFLCSDKASYMTGQVIAVDGGFESTGIGLPELRK
ncbi:MAG: SDR family oxidoreductase [Alphaproteobacteria bacterium]|nr:SDR family oxidoreductase [Alphaproteobacteria bacterium]